MLKENHLHLLRNSQLFENQQAAIDSFSSEAALNLANADGTPRLARYYADSAQTEVKTILGIFHQDTRSYTLFADSQSAAEIQQEIDSIEEAVGLGVEGEYVPYEEGEHTSGATNVAEALAMLDDALKAEEEKSDAIEDHVDDVEAQVQALDTVKADKEALVWNKDNEASTSIARNTKNQKVAEIKDNGELYLYIEGEYMNINDLLAQLAHETYDSQVEPVPGTSVVSNPEDPAELIVDNDTELIVSGSLSGAVVNNKMTVQGGEIVVNLADVKDVHADFNAAGNVTLNDFAVEGNLPKSVSNAGVSINTDGDVLIDGGSYAQEGYNGIEIGLGNTKLPGNVTIQNLEVTSNMSNNAILVFATKDDATITIKDCHFANVSNVLRLSNRTNATGVTVNIENVVVDQWDTNPDWAGFLILEDYVNRADTVATENVFGDGKITVNVKNLVYQGKKVMPKDGDLSTILGTRDADSQVMYIWNNYEAPDGFVPYDDEHINRWPVFNFE